LLEKGKGTVKVPAGIVSFLGGKKKGGGKVKGGRYHWGTSFKIDGGGKKGESKFSQAEVLLKGKRVEKGGELTWGVLEGFGYRSNFFLRECLTPTQMGKEKDKGILGPLEGQFLILEEGGGG